MDLQRVVMFPHRADIPHYQHYTIISYKELKQFFIAPPAVVSEVLEALVSEDFLHVYSAWVGLFYATFFRMDTYIYFSRNKQ